MLSFNPFKVIIRLKVKNPRSVTSLAKNSSINDELTAEMLEKSRVSGAEDVVDYPDFEVASDDMLKELLSI